MDKVHGLMGIAAKAGKVIAGMDIVLENLKRNKLALVIVANDASTKTIKEIEFKCNESNTKLCIYGNIDENSKAIGKSNKAIIGIMDKGLALAIEKLI